MRWVAVLPTRDRCWVLSPALASDAYWQLLAAWGRSRRRARKALVVGGVGAGALVATVTAWALTVLATAPWATVWVAGTLGAVTAVLAGVEVALAHVWDPPVDVARAGDPDLVSAADEVVWGSAEHHRLWEAVGGQPVQPPTPVAELEPGLGAAGALPVEPEVGAAPWVV